MHKLTGFSQALPQAINRLPELATNLWYSWNIEALDLFKSINAARWEEVYHNPVKLLVETDASEFTKLAENAEFISQYEAVVAKWDAYAGAATWFSTNYPDHSAGKIAYFSAEFGYHESLPIYSGGLGILAGDHCKSASDLGLPFVGVGLLYKKGYFKQQLDSFGKQQAETNHYDFNTLPIQAAKNEHGDDIYVIVNFPNREVKLKVWQANIGRIQVYLLDANLNENSDWDRELTAQLYGGTQDTRIAQEILLGMGGIKALRALNVPVAAYHINEGHAAFMAIERIKEYLRQGIPFHVGLELVRSSTLFTTHTPVPAGHDAFPLPMFEHYFGPLFQEFGTHHYDFIELGLDRNKQLFNMTHLALNTSALRNGVSKLHGHVSREMFQAFHGHIAVDDVPIRHVTNGVHLPTWLAPELKDLLDAALEADWFTNQSDLAKFEAVDKIASADLWNVHQAKKNRLIAYARQNIQAQRNRNGESAERIAEVNTFLSPDKLTIGFARRFATYKRATLLFSDLDRLDKIVNHPTRPVQFIFAGKAHPADFPGQDLIKEVYRVSQMDQFKGKIVMLENYDMYLASHLVQGVDVWLNNPLRPYEASGTSGQKAAMNGVPNFSILDGWWEEGYNGSNGWSIEGIDHGDLAAQDRANTESLYSVLENTIMPLYYTIDSKSALAEGWIQVMKNSITSLAPVYNTDRMVMDYTLGAYLPTMERGNRFKADNLAIAEQVADYKRFMFNHWHQMRIVHVDDTNNDGSSVASTALNSVLNVFGIKQNVPLKTVTVTLETGQIWYKDIAVEAVYYVQVGSEWKQALIEMTAVEPVQGTSVQFIAKIPAHLKYRNEFSIRVFPVSPNFIVPFELPLMTV